VRQLNITISSTRTEFVSLFYFTFQRVALVVRNSSTGLFVILRIASVPALTPKQL